MDMMTMYENVGTVLNSFGVDSGRARSNGRGVDITFDLTRDTRDVIDGVVKTLREYHNVRIGFSEDGILVYEVRMY